MGQCNRRLWAAALGLWVAAGGVGSFPLSKPIRDDSEISRVLDGFHDIVRGGPDAPRGHNVSYHERLPVSDVGHRGDASKQRPSSVEGDRHQCPLDIEVLWSTRLGAAIYSTPTIVPSLSGEGGLQVVAPTFLRYLELIHADEGLPPVGWPIAFDHDEDHVDHGGPSTFHGSAVVYDVNGDGRDDVCVVDGNGDVYWVAVGDYGRYLHDYKITVPKLKVRKDWYEGLDEKYADHYVEMSMFHHDRGVPERIGEERYGGGVDDVVNAENGGEPLRRAKHTDTFAAHAEPRLGRRLLQARSEDEGPWPLKRGATGRESLAGVHKSKRVEAQSSKLQLDASMQLPHRHDGAAGRSRRQLLTEPGEGEGEWDLEPADPGDSVVPDFGEGMQFGDDDGRLRYGYGDDFGPAFKDLYGYGAFAAFNDSDYVLVDSHVLSSPTIADINGDGHLELILTVSYFFDRVKYASKPPAPGVDPAKYVAGGVVCYDLELQDWIWTNHLDLTTDDQRWRAHIFASPTVADMDGDGHFEVIVGTSLGLLYVLDAASGFVRKNFPAQFGEIHSQVAVADVVTADGTGDLEMVFVDLNGNLLVVDHHGNVLWDRRLPGGSVASPTMGDVDGDGDLDVAVTCTAQDGTVYLFAVDGETGADLDHFPIRLGASDQGLLSPPVLLVDLHMETAGRSEIPAAPSAAIRGNGDGDQQRLRRSEAHAPVGGRAPGLHLLAPSFDGKLHIIEGGSGCVNHIDVGEHIYAMPLVHDLQGDGLLDLLVGTMNGELISYGTSVPFHPLNAWGQQLRGGGRNGFVHGREQGVFVYGGSDEREVVGRTFTLSFEIVDRRRMSTEAAARHVAKDHHMLSEEDRRPGEARYVVTVSHGSNTVAPLFTATYTEPGLYTIDLELARPQLARLQVLMVNEHGQHFADSVLISYNRQFFAMLKFLLVLPLFLIGVPLLMATENRKREHRKSMGESDLPT